MELANVKRGQLVRVTGASLFYSYNVGKIGTVTLVEGEHVSVQFSDGEVDYGYSSSLELISDALPFAKNAETIKEAIANVEAALEALKDLVG